MGGKLWEEVGGKRFQGRENNAIQEGETPGKSIRREEHHVMKAGEIGRKGCSR